jgi:hypothetical protein
MDLTGHRILATAACSLVSALKGILLHYITKAITSAAAAAAAHELLM